MCDGNESLSSDQPAWYVVTTKLRREDFAAGRLAERGIVSYLPMIAERRRPTGGEEAQPMFPSYLFVRAAMPDDFYRVAWTPGIRHFVGFGSGPARIEDAAVDFLKQAEGHDRLIRRRDDDVCQGTVRISHGPFRGFTAVVERRLPAHDRVLVLLQLLQRQTRVELPRGWVEPDGGTHLRA